MKTRRSQLNPYQRETVRAWWEALQPEDSENKKNGASRFHFDRGDRARLRRAASPDDLLLARAAHALGQAMYAQQSDNTAGNDGPSADIYTDLATVAGLLAHVREDLKDEKTLAWWLGNAVAKKNKPAAMGEMRFRRLLKVHSPDDLYIQWIRAVRLADRTVDVVQLADDALSWLRQLRFGQVHPSHNVKLYWAHDYYLDAKAQEGSESEQEKELNT